jgi:ATP-dependent Lon protease
VMPIEVSLVRGKGELLLTGQLGDVMKEAAKAGITYIRSRTKELQLDEEWYSKFDIHIHVPEGAVPKEGPSAGIGMATALVSAIRAMPVRRDVAMTGEITLRGRVLPIGGVKEKVLAAHRAGIKTMILPRDNEKDLEKVNPLVKKDMRFVLVKHMDEVLQEALVH